MSMFMRVRAYRLKPDSLSGDSLETKTAAPKQGHHFADRPTRFLRSAFVFFWRQADFAVGIPDSMS